MKRRHKMLRQISATFPSCIKMKIASRSLLAIKTVVASLIGMMLFQKKIDQTNTALIEIILFAASISKGF